MRRPAIITIALLAAACGSSNGPSSANDVAAAGFKFAACMRSHGISGYPDPQVTTGQGQTEVRQMAPSSLAPSRRLNSAEKACQHIISPVNTGPDQAQVEARKAVRLAFAQCLRGHGVPSFPDPTAQGQLSLDMINAAGVDLHSPSFFKAAKACVGVTHGAITLAQVEQAINGHH